MAGVPERLQKILARAGYGSRRACERLILDGRVSVDGRTVSELGTRADPERQRIAVDGKPIGKLEDLVYYALNKPSGVLCSSFDPEGRPLAVDLIPERRRIYTVGRLDKDTEGLILLTNDGELTNLLTHPRYGVPRTYLARVAGDVTPAVVAKLRRGVWLSEGRTGPAIVRVKRRGRNSSTITVSIREGLNREVRRMLASVGLKVRRLRRIRIGRLRLDDMPAGSFRRLSAEEVRELRECAERAIRRPPSRLTVPGRRRDPAAGGQCGGPGASRRDAAGDRGRSARERDRRRSDDPRSYRAERGDRDREGTGVSAGDRASHGSKGSGGPVSASGGFRPWRSRARGDKASGFENGAEERVWRKRGKKGKREERR